VNIDYIPRHVAAQAVVHANDAAIWLTETDDNRVSLRFRSVYSDHAVELSFSRDDLKQLGKLLVEFGDLTGLNLPPS
jgi:hypothetical protein